MSVCTDSRFAEPRCSLQRERVVTFCVVQKVTKKHTECAVPAGTNFLQSGKFQKVLILLEGSRHCGELNRGLRNLGAPCKGERVVTFCVVQKVTKKHTGRSPATHDSNRRSIRCFCENDRHSSGNRFCEKLQLRRVSPAMI